MKTFLKATAQVLLLSVLLTPIQLTGQEIEVWATDSALCCGSTTQLFASSGDDTTGTYTFSWSSDPQTPGWPTTEQNPVVNPGATTVYTVTVSDGSTFEQESLTIEVYYPPVNDLGGDITSCIYDSVVLTANIADMEYHWSNGSLDRSIKVGCTGIGIEVKQVWLEIICEAGCIGRDTVQLTFDYSECFYSVEEQKENPNISVYPNPSNGLVMVKVKDAGENIQIAIYNLQGQRLLSRYRHLSHWGNYEEQIDISAYPKGIYLLRVVNDREVYQEKILVE